MKKLSAMVITLVLLVSSFSVVSAAPWDNPNGFWLHDVSCGDKGTFDVWVPNDFTKASFDNFGGVGISKALYIDVGNGYEQVWKIPGNGVFNKTTWCEWEYDGLPMAGEILIP